MARARANTALIGASSRRCCKSVVPCRLRSVRRRPGLRVPRLHRRRISPAHRARTGRSESRSELTRPASSRPKPQQAPLRLAARGQPPNFRRPSLQGSSPLLHRLFRRVSSWSRSSRLVLFRSRASCAPSSRPSRQPPRELGSSFLDMRAGVPRPTTSSACPRGCAPRRSQNSAAAQHRLAPDPTSESASRAMASFGRPCGARDSPSAHLTLSDDGWRHTCGMQSASG